VGKADPGGGDQRGLRRCWWRILYAAVSGVSKVDSVAKANERRILGSVRRNETVERAAGFWPSPPTCAAQQVGSYLGYSDRGGNASGKAARVASGNRRGGRSCPEPFQSGRDATGPDQAPQSTSSHPPHLLQELCHSCGDVIDPSTPTRLHVHVPAWRARDVGQ
jgi:hypothetical protein